MTSIVDANGNVLTAAALKAKASTVSQPVLRSFTEDIYETYTLPGDAVAETRKRKKYYAGQQVYDTALDANVAYTAGTITSTSPATLAAAGGTVLTINGTGFHGVTAITFGGTAGTNIKKLSSTKLQVTSPAKTAGSVALVVTTPAGNITGTNVTYV